MEQKSKPAIRYFYNSGISHLVGITEILVLWRLVDRFQAFISLKSVKVYCYYLLSATCIQSLFYICVLFYFYLSMTATRSVFLV